MELLLGGSDLGGLGDLGLIGLVLILGVGGGGEVDIEGIVNASVGQSLWMLKVSDRYRFSFNRSRISASSS